MGRNGLQYWKKPALHTHMDYTAKSVLKNTPKDFTYGALVKSAMHSDSTMQPGMPLLLNSAENPILSQTQIDKFGKIRYEDIFGKEHHTTFCFQMGRDLRTVASCKEYNQSD